MSLHRKTLLIREITLILLILVADLFSSVSGFSQGDIQSTDSLRQGALRIFIDCWSCDMNYTRQEIPYVNYVRDTYEADVFLLVSNQNAGSGGQQFTFTFEGLGKFKGMHDTLVYTSNPDETSSVVREKKTNLIKMGLMRYVAKTPLFTEIEIKSNSEKKQEEVTDNWNNWVFELQTSPRYNAEATYNRVILNNSINISKVTPDIKLQIELEQSNNKQRYIEDEVVTEYIRSRQYANILFVKSLNSNWSAGLRWNLGASTSANYKFNTEFLPSIEYDVYPYDEATHRQFRFLYSIGYQFSNYIDTTVFDKTMENLYKHELGMAYQVQKKWGSVNISLSGSNYFHDFSKNRVDLYGYMRLRIIKGLGLSVNGGIAYINDQINLPKGELSEAEVLLRLKQQATNFNFWGGVSLSYTFGSIYNNVVNPRFGNGGGGGGDGFY